MDRTRTGRQTHNLSLGPDLSDALLYLAGHRYPSANGKLLTGPQSWIVQDLLSREIVSVLGPDWRELLALLELPGRPRRDTMTTGASL